MTTPSTTNEEADKAPLWWRALEWLPSMLFTPCGTCLFWRGAAVGAVITAAIAGAIAATT